MPLAGQELWRGAGGNQGVEARYGSASDGDEAKGKDRPGEYRSRAVDKFRHGGHLQAGREDHDRAREQSHGTDFHEGAQIITRREQQPNGKRGGGQRISHDAHCQGRAIQRQPTLDDAAVNPLLGPNREQQGCHAQKAYQANVRLALAHRESHGHCDWHGGKDSRKPPRALCQRFHHNQRQHRQNNHQDRYDAHQRDESRKRTDLFADHLAEEFAAPTDRAEHHDGIMHGSAECCTDEHPQEPRQKAELRSQNRPHQRSRSGDSGEVMPKNDPFVGWHKILAVLMKQRRGGARLVEREHLRHEPGRMEPEGNCEHADRSNDDPQGADGFPSPKGEHAQRQYSNGGENSPAENFENAAQ